MSIAPPRSGILRDPALHATAASVVRVTGTACGLGVEGSGWVARPGLVVTNAHVVAGESDTSVQVDGTGPHLSAQPIAFDVHDDLAVLRVGPGLDRPPLQMSTDPAPGTPGAVMGYPLNGPFDARPARIGAEEEAISQDAYGRGPVRRLIVPLRALVRPGNSGGPVVDGQGRVLATVFAATVGAGPHAGFAVPDAVVRTVVDHASGPVGTGPCAG
jgi:S1-C subfamily serine protease